jgi:hypothetical protein
MNQYNNNARKYLSSSPIIIVNRFVISRRAIMITGTSIGCFYGRCIVNIRNTPHFSPSRNGEASGFFPY